MGCGFTILSDLIKEKDLNKAKMNTPQQVHCYARSLHGAVILSALFCAMSFIHSWQHPCAQPAKGH